MPLRVSCLGPVLRLASGGVGQPGPVFAPTWLGALRSPWSGSAHPGRSGAGGWGGGGGGGGPCAAPPVCAARGASGAGGRSASFRPSAFPGQATKRVSLGSFWSRRAWPPYRSGSLSPAFSGRGPCGVLVRWRGFACSPLFLWEPAAGAGGAGRAPAPLTGAAVPPGGGGFIPSASGGWGPAPPRLAGRRGGWGVGGRAAAPLLPLLGAAHGSLPCPPLIVGAFPPACAFRRGRGASPCSGCGLPGGGGGRRGGPWTAPPGAPSDPKPPSPLPDWATLWVSLALLWSWGARPP